MRKQGYIKFDENQNDGSCTLYFKRDYYALLTDLIFNAFYQGKFRQSNAKFDWNELKNTIDQAEVSDKENVENLELYGVYDE